VNSPAEAQDNPHPLPRPVTLSPQDQAAVDLVLGRQASPCDPARQQRLASVLRVLGACPAESPRTNLVAQTLQRVAATANKPWNPRTEPLRFPVSPFSLAEIGAIAAMVIVGFSLALPVLVRHRAEARRIACQSNLALAGVALERYAADFNGYLPRGEVQPGSPWFNVGQVRRDEPVESNSAHLFLLARQGYISPETLNCPENAHAPVRLARDSRDWPTAQAVGFSYQNQYSPRAQRVTDNPSLAILADRNPLFVIQPGEGLKTRGLRADAPSFAHGGRGQNVLVGAGNADWRTRPVMPGGDNIWLPRSTFSYTGTETPDTGDAFLVP
jgi:hypothetical protein